MFLNHQTLIIYMINLTTIKYGAIVLVLSAAFIGLPVMYNKWRDAERSLNQVSDYAKYKDKEVTYYKNLYGQEVAKTEALTLDRKSLKELREEFEYLSKEFQGVKKNLKNVSQITKVTASILDTLTLSNRDTTFVVNNEIVTGRTFTWEEPYNKVTGLVMRDTTSIVMDIEVPLDLVVFWERKRILGLKIGRKSFNVQGKSDNERVRLTELQNITIKKR